MTTFAEQMAADADEIFGDSEAALVQSITYWTPSESPETEDGESLTGQVLTRRHYYEEGDRGSGRIKNITAAIPTSQIDGIESGGVIEVDGSKYIVRVVETTGGAFHVFAEKYEYTMVGNKNARLRR